jgi:NADPH-dependent 2,4-dienoyl-CoA reductase/sulfur reductase-like enzyme
MAPRRLPPQGEERVLSFRWGRRRVRAREGDTVASALLVAGHTILARSVKYHRPRSFLCGVGKCANCLVTIDGKPSQRACMVPAHEGMHVQGQNAWPSPQHDLFAASDAMFREGFDPQRSFTKPGFVVPLYHEAVRRMAGLGKVPRDDRPARVGPVAQEEARLAIVGAGPAGLAAAWEASRAGVAVKLFDEQPWPGGRLSWETERLAGPGEFAGMPPAEALRFLLARLAEAHATPRTRANVAGIYGERFLAVQTPQRLTEVRADAVVLASGAPESLPLFGDNDKPGILSAMGASILLQRHGVLPGRRVVLVGADPRTLQLGRDLARAGADIEALVTSQPPKGSEFRALPGEVVRAFGGGWLRGVEVRVGGETLRLDCDLLVFAEPRRPAVELAQQAGCKVAWRGDAPAVQVDASHATTAPRVFAAGDVVAPGTLEAALASGRVAGLQAARALGAKVDEGRLADAEDALAAGRGDA